MRVLERLCLTSSVLILALFVGDGTAQSLPQVARQQRERQGETGKARVFTNDNVPQDASVTVSEEEVPETGEARGAPEPSEVSSEEVGTAPAPAERTEAQWRELFDEAREELARSEDRVALTQEELDDLNHQLLTRSDIYNREQVLPPLIRAKEEELGKARQNVEAATARLSELRTELRRAGRPAGWGRP